MTNLTHASFVLTDACNLQCQYCFVKQQPLYMTEETAKRGVDFLIQGALQSQEERIEITFFGGEPTLCMHLINYIFDYANEQSKIASLEKPRYTLITNGMRFDEEVQNFILKWKAYTSPINIQLSLDGPPDIETQQRVSKLGLDSGVLMEQNLAKIYDFCYRNNIIVGQEVYIHPVITKATLPQLFEIYKYFCQHNFPGIWYQLLNDEDWDDHDADIYKQQLNLIFDYYKDNDLMEYMVGNKSFDSDLKCMDCTSKRACEAGERGCAIDPNGGIHICHRFYCNSPELQLGDLYQDPIIYNTAIKQYYESITIADMIGDKPCNDCEDSNCRKCLAVNEAYNKVPTLCFPKYCTMVHAEREFKQKLAIHLSAIFSKTKISDAKLIVLKNRLDNLERAFNNLSDLLGAGFNQLEEQQTDILNLLLAAAINTEIFNQRNKTTNDQDI